jgi:hypothetical protein
LPAASRGALTTRRRAGAGAGCGDRDLLQGELRRELRDVRRDARPRHRREPAVRTLTAAAGAPEWNFNKYLLDRHGRVVARYGAGTEPDGPQLLGRVDALLAAS